MFLYCDYRVNPLEGTLRLGRPLEADPLPLSVSVDTPLQYTEAPPHPFSFPGGARTYTLAIPELASSYLIILRWSSTL